jgi:hypothetical protein
MCAVLDQRYEADLWECAAAAAGSRSPKGGVIHLLVGDIKGAAVDTGQAQTAIPRNFWSLSTQPFNENHSTNG